MFPEKASYSKYIISALITILLLLSSHVNAQLSSGGKPLDISHATIIKTDFKHQVIIPEYVEVQKASIIGDNSLQKNLEFGHVFTTNLTPNNSGTTYQTKYFNIWQVEIISENALSINLAFDKFHIPNGARLFVFNEDRTTILGAFTARNNSSSNVLAVFPVAGEKVIVQYEEPIKSKFKGELLIGKVVHGYLDVLNQKNLFYPRRESQSCNIDVQCDTESGLEKQKRAVCRVFVLNSLGTATLVNNTKQDATPYLVSAYHVFNNMDNAQYAIFQFNYESPACTGIEGYDIQTLCGATALAGNRQTDMILLRLSEVPPAYFCPYFAGWDARPIPPQNNYCIHHPNGDTKKISHDEGICDSINFLSGLENGHWRVLNWEMGATELGSSGGGLFNIYGKLIGTLSGGKASCDSLDYDAFARFDKMYDYFDDDTSQLKVWLNPTNDPIEQLPGLDPYIAKHINCTTVSNFEQSSSAFTNSTVTSYYTGNNLLGITEIASEFTQFSRGQIEGVTIGVDQLKIKSLDPSVQMHIYESQLDNEHLIYTQTIKLEDLLTKAYNYIKITDNVFVEDNFFVSFELLNSSNSISFFHSSLKPGSNKNHLYLKQDGTWKPSNEVLEEDSIADLLLGVNICKFEFTDNLSEHQKVKLAYLFPNPVQNLANLSFDKQGVYTLSIIDSYGKLIKTETVEIETNYTLDFSNLPQGIYLLNIENLARRETFKVLKN